MDQIRDSYVEKIKISSHSHSTLPTSSESVVDNLTLGHANETNSLMKRITVRGWALPQRSTFRYTYEQKGVLYDMFMEGEKTGMKIQPEEVEKIFRQKFNRDQWVDVVQIRSLFSRYSQKFRAGTLKAPTQKQPKNNGNTVSHEEDNVETEEAESSSDEENDEKEEEAESISSNELNDDAYYTELSIVKQLESWKRYRIGTSTIMW